MVAVTVLAAVSTLVIIVVVAAAAAAAVVVVGSFLVLGLFLVWFKHVCLRPNFSPKLFTTAPAFLLDFRGIRGPNVNAVPVRCSIVIQ